MTRQPDAQIEEPAAVVLEHDKPAASAAAG
jgi:hypothetical protein